MTAKKPTRSRRVPAGMVINIPPAVAEQRIDELLAQVAAAKKREESLNAQLRVLRYDLGASETARHELQHAVDVLVSRGAGQTAALLAARRELGTGPTPKDDLEAPF